MIDNQLQLLVKYRLQEAVETLRESELLLNQSAFSAIADLVDLVGWVDNGNPTLTPTIIDVMCWVALSFNPTYRLFLKR